MLPHLPEFSGEACAPSFGGQQFAGEIEANRKGQEDGFGAAQHGQSDQDATAHLDAMNKIGGLPWRLTFSYGRALQAAPQKAWAGQAANVAAGQAAFSHRARMNALASRGQWDAALESKAA